MNIDNPHKKEVQTLSDELQKLSDENLRPRKAVDKLSILDDLALTSVAAWTEKIAIIVPGLSVKTLEIMRMKEMYN